MDEQTQAVKAKRRRSRTEIQQLIAEYEVSGLGRTAFCQQKGLSLSTLARYRKRQEQATTEVAAGKRWLAVEMSGGASAASDRSSGLTVVLSGGRRIEVVRGFDDETLTRLLAVVERG